MAMWSQPVNYSRILALTTEDNQLTIRKITY
jgi:hypothetical protein